MLLLPDVLANVDQCCLLGKRAAGSSVESKDVSKVDEALLAEVEADVYWCLTKLLDNIQV